MSNISSRGELDRCPGAEAAARAALDAASCTADALDFVELYSCFPIAMDLYAEALGLAPDATRSFTGGMPFAGGPFNNFVLHATAQLAKRLRGESGTRGLVSTVSGVLTKQGFAIWGSEANPQGFRAVDVTSEAQAQTLEQPVVVAYSGRGSHRGLYGDARPIGTHRWRRRHRYARRASRGRQHVGPNPHRGDGRRGVGGPDGRRRRRALLRGGGIVSSLSVVRTRSGGARNARS